MQTYAQLLASIEQTLIDLAATSFLAAEYTQAINQTKINLAQYVPYVMRHTATTVVDSRDIELGNINNLIEVQELEYPIDEYPHSFRNFERRGMTLSMLLDTAPDEAESAYLWIAKPHVIMAATDLVGAVDLTAGYAAGVTTIHVDGLGSADVLEEDSVFTIAGLSGSYRLTAPTTLATSEGDITFDPGLAAAVLNDAVLTFYASSLFDPRIENIFIDMAAAQMAINKARYYMGRVTVGAQNTPQQLMAWGNAKMSDAIRRVLPLSLKGPSVEYSRE